MKKEIKELRSLARKLEPVIRIGKNDLSERAISEIDKAMEKRGLIKIKLLKSSFLGRDRKEFVKELVMKTRSQLVGSIGSVVVIYRP